MISRTELGRVKAARTKLERFLNCTGRPKSAREAELITRVELALAVIDLSDEWFDRLLLALELIAPDAPDDPDFGPIGRSA